jgi:hypothetical protein
VAYTSRGNLVAVILGSVFLLYMYYVSSKDCPKELLAGIDENNYTLRFEALGYRTSISVVLRIP